MGQAEEKNTIFIEKERKEICNNFTKEYLSTCRLAFQELERETIVIKINKYIYDF